MSRLYQLNYNNGRLLLVGYTTLLGPTGVFLDNRRLMTDQ
jgi:hypothetical protein